MKSALLAAAAALVFVTAFSTADAGQKHRDHRDKRVEQKRDHHHKRHHSRKRDHHRRNRGQCAPTPTPEPKPVSVPESFSPPEQRNGGTVRIQAGQSPAETRYSWSDGQRADVFVYEHGVAGRFTRDSQRAVGLVASGAARLEDMELERLPNGIYRMTVPSDNGADLPFRDWLTSEW